MLVGDFLRRGTSTFSATEISLAARGRGFALWLLGARLSRITLDLSLLNISIRVRGLGEAFPFFILAVGLDSLDPMD